MAARDIGSDGGFPFLQSEDRLLRVHMLSRHFITQLFPSLKKEGCVCVCARARARGGGGGFFKIYFEKTNKRVK